MTDKILQEIADRAEAATPGPWRAHITNRRKPEVYSDGNAHRPDPNPLVAASILRKRDAEFIAHARSDVDFLLSELQKAREALEPFAAFHEALKAMGGNYPKTGTVYAIEPRTTGLRELTAEDFAAARQALSPAPVGEEGS